MLKKSLNTSLTLILMLLFTSLAQAQPFAAATTSNATLEQLGLSGVLTLDEYDWFSTTPYLGVIEINLSSGQKRRLAEGRNPWRHQSGNVIFAQPCGSNVHRIMLIDASGLPQQISPCSSDLPNDGASDTNFEFSRLSPDQTKVAIESNAYLDWDYAYSTVVFDRDQNLLASFDGHFAPEWLPDGRLLLGGDGLYIVDANLQDIQRLDAGRLQGIVNNIDVDPTGTRIVFEFNQQIFYMNLDGSDLRELIYGNAVLRFPTWSPDGKMLAYLATPSQDNYFASLFFTNLETGESYSVDLSPLLLGNSSSQTVNGPLSWR